MNHSSFLISACHCTLNLALIIADLAGSGAIAHTHLIEVSQCPLIVKTIYR